VCVPTAQLRTHVRLRAAAYGAHRREPSVAKRIRAGGFGPAFGRPVVARA
jgi:hypothetical protein